MAENKLLHELSWHKYTLNRNRKTNQNKRSAVFFFIITEYYNGTLLRWFFVANKHAHKTSIRRIDKYFYFNDSLCLFGFWMKQDEVKHTTFWAKLNSFRWFLFFVAFVLLFIRWWLRMGYCLNFGLWAFV